MSATQMKFRFHLTRKPLAVREMFAASAEQCVRDYLFSLGYRGTTVYKMSETDREEIYSLVNGNNYIVSVTVEK